MNWEVRTMASRTSFFDTALFGRALRRWWPMALALSAAQLYMCMMALQNVGPAGYDRGYAVLMEALQSPLPAVFACAAAMLAYRYLHAVRDAAFMAALPVKRSALFLSQGAAALVLLLGAEGLCALLTPLFAGTPGQLFPVMGRWFWITAALTGAYFGFASLCAVLTGHSLAVPALYALGLYAAVALEASVRTMAQYLIFGLGNQQWKLTVLSPLYYLKRFSYNLLWTEVAEFDAFTGSPLRYTIEFTGRWTVLGYLAAGVVFIALALVLLRNRPAEAAGDVIAVRLLRPAFRVGAALAAGCAGGMLLLRTVFGYTGYYAGNGSGPKVLLLFFMLLLGGFVGWFGAQMLLQKSLRVFDRHWPGYGVWAALALLAVLGCKLDLFGVERSIPAEEKIGSVSVSCYEVGVNNTAYKDPENIAKVRELHRTVVENKALFQRSDDPRYASGGMGYAYGYNPGGTLIIQYFDKDGGILLTREYAAPSGEMAWASNGDSSYTGGEKNPALAQLETLVNTNEAVEQRCLPAEGFLLRPETTGWGNVGAGALDEWGYYLYDDLLFLDRSEVYELCTQAIFPDFKDSSLGYLRLRPQYQQDLPAASTVTINLGMDNPDQYWYWYGRVTADAHRTIAWLQRHGVELDDRGNFTGTLTPEESEW